MAKYVNATLRCYCNRYLSETEAQFGNKCTDCKHQELYKSLFGKFDLAK